MPAVQLVVPRLLMAQKLNDKSTNDLDSTTGSQTSIFVLLSARAIGSLGFAVSLLAIWFGWLLPASLTASAPSDTSEIKKPRPAHKHHHRKSASSWTGSTPNPTKVRRSSVPIDLAPILVPHSEETLHGSSSRRVSFAESPLTPVVRRNTMPQPKSRHSLASSLYAIPRLPSSPSPSRPGIPPSIPDDLNAQDSDCSSRPSRLNKLKLGFNLKTNRQLPVEKHSDGDSITSIESTVSEKATKWSSGSFVAAWSNSRARTAGDENECLASPSRLSFVRLLSPGTPSTTAAETITPSSSGFSSDILLSRKSERRRSTPIPRTRPYGAPYFASPPVLLDKNSYPSYLKALPQFDDEFEFSSARASERGRKPVVLLGNGSLKTTSRKVVPKRRSASEDWTVRSPTTELRDVL